MQYSTTQHNAQHKTSLMLPLRFRGRSLPRGLQVRNLTRVSLIVSSFIVVIVLVLVVAIVIVIRGWSLCLSVRLAATGSSRRLCGGLPNLSERRTRCQGVFLVAARGKARRLAKVAPSER